MSANVNYLKVLEEFKGSVLGLMNEDVDLKVYLKGEENGRYGRGAIVYARRDEMPYVRKGQLYEIDEVVRLSISTCDDRTLGLRVSGLEGDYTRNTFRVTRDCKRLMEMKEGGLEVSLDRINEVGIDSELVCVEKV